MAEFQVVSYIGLISGQNQKQRVSCKLLILTHYRERTLQ